MDFLNYRIKFLLKNLFRGLLILALIVILYILLQLYTPFDGFIDYVGKWPFAVYLVFIISEVVLGIIPPELFMIWSIKHGIFNTYFLNILLLSGISFFAGVTGYFIGRHAVKIKWMQQFLEKYVLRYKNLLKRFGGILIVIGAVTPIPFSAICMVVGATNYKFSKFLLIACSRFIRFAAYSAVILQANI
ncbi:hypothetical protein FNH22_20195 [Fulvivirga sp. M361]|uniref:YqaA family protein n=1 Tax=Fulvivirga sp. M361 TaxID=2594266 RepID=UPI00117B7AD8|nr:VTT domain-containing protein [Fulvivirga sp. M361]TRX53678.1 hypothetical protein FNH22_20195 [Fulvivirga sp. M361]